MDERVETVVLTGPGTLTRVADGIVLAGVSGNVRQVIETVRATADQPVATRAPALAAVVGDTDGLAVVVASAEGAAAVLGRGLQLRSDHIGYRLLRQGPCSTVLTGCTRLAVVPPTTPWSPPQDAARLEVGVRSGAGFWAALAETTGLGHDLVEGVMCACGAFGHPMTLRCRACGAVIAIPRPGGRQPRIPVCQLVMDDARSLAVDGPVVIGREPQRAEEVQRGIAYPLVLTDNQRSVSRVHAVLHLEGWDLVLEERHSSNGISVRPQDAGLWSRLEPGSRVRILPGTDIALGRRTVRVLG
ncbi:MAG TPA: FHA domain-containing protein [Euzebya sp.]|nr:FHA domain-containing protein [Euzebya sp.]